MRAWTALAAAALVMVSGAPSADSAPRHPAAVGWLAGVEKARLAAFRADDKAAFKRMVSPDLTIVHSNGEIGSLADELASMRPSTPGDPLPVLLLEDLKERRYGNAAILTGSLVERQGSRVVLRLRFTNTYVLQRNRWILAAGQLTRVTA